MVPLPTCDLVRLVEIMNDMHDSAITSNWEQLDFLDKERRKILQLPLTTDLNTENGMGTNSLHEEHLINKGVDIKSAPLSDAKRDFLIAEIRNLDTQILDVVQSGRQRLLDENRGLSAQLKAKELYAKTSTIT